MNEMKRIVICKHCGEPEYYGDMRWLSGWCGCRRCYKARYEEIHRQLYTWDDLDGKVPTMEEYETQLIDEFIRDSSMHGFSIITRNGDGKYSCITKCNICNEIIIAYISIQLTSIGYERKVQCELPIYCSKCQGGSDNG